MMNFAEVDIKRQENRHHCNPEFNHCNIFFNESDISYPSEEEHFTEECNKYNRKLLIETISSIIDNHQSKHYAEIIKNIYIKGKTKKELGLTDFQTHIARKYIFATLREHTELKELL